MSFRNSGSGALALLLALALAAVVWANDDPSQPDSATAARLTAQTRVTLGAAARPGPLRAGEDLTFDVHYGLVHAGEAHLEILGIYDFSGARCYRLRSRARSSGFFGKLYDVDDRIESHLDSVELMSRGIEKHMHEGSYHQDLAAHFDYGAMRARYATGDSASLPGPVQDDLSAFFVARCLELRENTTYYLMTHSNRVNYPMQVRVYGRENIHTELGDFDCFRVEPRVDRGGIFKHRGGMTLWLTVDARHVPVRMRSKLPVGAITADLVALNPGPAR